MFVNRINLIVFICCVLVFSSCNWDDSSGLSEDFISAVVVDASSQPVAGASINFIYQTIPHLATDFPEFLIDLVLVESEHILLEVYSPQGQLIATLVDAVLDSGEHSIPFNVEFQPAGMYTLYLTMNDQSSYARIAHLPTSYDSTDIQSYLWRDAAYSDEDGVFQIYDSSHMAIGQMVYSVEDSSMVSDSVDVWITHPTYGISIHRVVLDIDESHSFEFAIE
jgi:hypothetical protein